MHFVSGCASFSVFRSGFPKIGIGIGNDGGLSHLKLKLLATDLRHMKKYVHILQKVNS
jgi:hypothetical protein